MQREDISEIVTIGEEKFKSRKSRKRKESKLNPEIDIEKHSYQRKFDNIHQLIINKKLQIPNISFYRSVSSNRIYKNIKDFISKSTKVGRSVKPRISWTIREVEIDDLGDLRTSRSGRFIPYTQPIFKQDLISSSIDTYLVYSFIPKERVHVGDSMDFIEIRDGYKIFKKYRGFTAAFDGLEDVLYKTTVKQPGMDSSSSLYTEWESNENIHNIVQNYYSNIYNSKVYDNSDKHNKIINKYLSESVNRSMLSGVNNIISKFTVKHHDIMFVISIIHKYSEVFDININTMNVLDMAAGWFDRLSGVALAGETGCRKYVSFDPNTDLKKSYNKIKGFLERQVEGKSRSNTIIDHKFLPFEEADLGDPDLQTMKFFHMILISPPYYDKELYSEGQSSIIQYNNFTEWFKGWMLPMLNKSLIHLILNKGWAVISVDDSHGNLHKLILDWILGEKEEDDDYFETYPFPNRGRFKIVGTLIKTSSFNIFSKYATSIIIVKRTSI